MNSQQRTGPQKGNGFPGERWIAYMENRLSEEEQREMEMWLSEEGSMESDAIEGLQEIPPRMVRKMTSRINRAFRKKAFRKFKRRSSPVNGFLWSIVALVILLLAAICFLLVYITP